MTGQGRAGSTLGQYELRRLVARGHAGELYEAYDRQRERTVALRLLGPTTDPAQRERLLREARRAAQVQNPYLVPIHEVGEIDGQGYLDMRLVDGTDLGVLLGRHGRLAPEVALDVVRQLGDALDAIHRAGLTHRDLRPGTVLVLPTGVVALSGLGVADAGGPPDQAGGGGAALAYTAPERAGASPVAAAADTYALGCLLYEMLTGRVPFDRGSASATMNAHRHEEPIPVTTLRTELPPAVDAVVGRAMAKDPTQRYPSAHAMTADLAAVLRTEMPYPGEALAAVATRSAPGSTGAGTTEGGSQDPTRGGAGALVGARTAPRRDGPRTALVVALVLAAVLLGAAGVAAVRALSGDEPGQVAAGEGSGAATAQSPGRSVAGSGTRSRGPSNSPTEVSSRRTSTSSTTTATETTTSSAPTTSTPSATSSPSATSTAAAPTASTPATSTTASSGGGNGSAAGVGPTIAAGSGYDWQGWTAPGAARCNANDRALVAGRTAGGRTVVVCEVYLRGPTYYKGVTSSGSIELDPVRPVANAWQVSNRGYIYTVSPEQLLITRQGGEVVVLEDPMAEYHAA